ncbi:hypothetical protein [Psychromonas sp. 14N.309.X.WAT.B.A12]|jgi:hypothetical protein|uniref:hypothetical protein n=1 Tax=unclassified Psychromonas TaxID=2614957 RepID=UPI0025B0E41E|nr:hypothetical protein [Psychromonas sp. 14N.309.X.WAT.B.A12]MDN2664927.1 hypothetical protein [Psychromonas sp. 14N.309.X.WAT.B.A12]
MFKLFVLYPFIALVCIWLSSDVEVDTSIYKLDDNSVSIEFPKARFRETGTEPWFTFYWQVDHEAQFSETLIELE